MRMKHLSRATLALVALLVAAAAFPQPRAPERVVAVTFDDPPATAAGVVANDVASLEELTRKLLAAVRKHSIPAVGFVNEGKLFEDGAGPRDVEGRTRLLRMWLDAGLELGNHTYSHRDLNTMPLEDFEADVLRGEAVTRPPMKAQGQTLRHFRHPFLHVDSDLKRRRAFEAFLARHGYRVAPVTVDNDDFVYAGARQGPTRRQYRGRRADRRGLSALHDRGLHVLRGRFEERDRPRDRQVLLLHANSLNADHFDALAEALVRRGYRFVTLAHALEDPAYRLPDTFGGAPGNSWFNRWEITAGRKPVPTPSRPNGSVRGSTPS